MSVWDWVFFLPTWLNVLIAAVVLIYIYGVWPYKTTKMTYPGPPPLPLIGNLRTLIKQGVTEFDKEAIKKYGKFTLTWASRQPQLLVADPDVIREVCVKQFPYFINRAVTRGRIAMSKIERNQITILEDDHWKFVRATLSPAFSSGRLREMTGVLQTCNSHLLDVVGDRSKEGKSFNVQGMFQSFTLDAISSTAFGMESCIQKNPDDPFALLLKKLFAKKTSILIFVVFLFPFVARILSYFDISVMPKESQMTTDAISRDVKHNIEQRKQQNIKRRDLLQLMIDAKIDDLKSSGEDVDTKMLENKIQEQRKGLTETEIMAQSFVFLLAGYATTAGTLGFVAYNLALNPECQDKLIEEIDKEVKKETPTYESVMTLPYLDMCLSETLRMYPPASRITREASQDVVIKGHLIPKGTSVNVPVGYLHRNPEYYPEPEKFKPERFTPEEKAKRHPFVYLPFGQGPRNCVGMRLAQLEIKMAMAAILQKFRFVRSVDTEVPLKLATMGLAEPENGIWLKVEPRSDI